LGSQATAATKKYTRITLHYITVHYSPRTIQNLCQLFKEVSTEKAYKYEAITMYMTVHK
jgi:hypothetical protein